MLPATPAPGPPDDRAHAGNLSRDARRSAAAPGRRRRSRRGPVPSARRPRAGPARRPARGDGLVVGPVPPAPGWPAPCSCWRRSPGVAAALPDLPGGRRAGARLAATGFGGALVALLVPVVHLAVGVVLVRGAVPKFGLAYAGVAGALALGQLLIEIYRGSSSTARPASRCSPGSGC